MRYRAAPRPLNPFRHGGAVTGPDFVDREEELKTLVSDILSGGHLLIESPRRMGKTSLIREAFRRLNESSPERVLMAYVDVFGLTSKRALGASMLRELWRARPSTSLNEAQAFVGRNLPSLRPRITSLPGGALDVDPVWPEDIDTALEEVLDLPHAIAEDSRKRVAVAFDEFQEVSVLGGTPLVKRMRSHFQRHSAVSYLFAGSRTHLLRQVFDEQEGAFYRFARPMTVGPIPAEAWSFHIRSVFGQAKIAIADDVIQVLLERTEGSPFATQRICAELWDLRRKLVRPEVVELAFGRAVDSYNPIFERVWEGIESNEQRLLLRAVAEDGHVSYGTDFIGRHSLKSSAHVQRSAAALELKGVLTEGRILDPFFRDWIRRRTR